MSTWVNGTHSESKPHPLARDTESHYPSSKRASWPSDLGQGPAILFPGQWGWQPQDPGQEAQTVRELQAAFGDPPGHAVPEMSFRAQVAAAWPHSGPSRENAAQTAASVRPEATGAPSMPS